MRLRDDQIERLHFLSSQITAVLVDTIGIKVKHEYYADSLSAVGLITKNGRLRGRWLSARIRKWLKPIADIQPFGDLVEALKVERNWSTVAVACEGGFTHPLKHIIIWGAIGCTWHDLVNAASTPGHQLELDLVRVRSSSLSEGFLSDVFQRTSSLSAAAAELGCDVTTAGVHADRLGFVYKRRPKKVTDEVRTSVLAAIRLGLRTRDVASRFSLSVTTVNRIRRSSTAIPNDDS